MFPSTAFRDSDTFNFHADLFRCFLLSLLDPHHDLALVFNVPDRLWVVLRQRLADVTRALAHDDDPVSRRTSSLIRCPPERRYEVNPPAPEFFVTTPRMDQSMPFAPFVAPPPHWHDHDDNKNIDPDLTRGLLDEHSRSAGNADSPLPGYTGLLGGGGAGMVDHLLWCLSAFALVIVVLRWRAPSEIRATYWRPKAAVDVTSDSGNLERAIRYLPWLRRLGIQEASQCLADDPHEVSHRASVPASWLLERREQSALMESVMDTMSWTLFAQMGIRIWTHFPRLALIFDVLDPLGRGPGDVVSIRRRSEEARSPEMDGFDFDGGISTPAAPNGAETSSAALNRIHSELDFSIGHSIMAMHNRHRGPLAICDVAIKDPKPAQTTQDVICGAQVGLSLALVASNHAADDSDHKGMVFDSDKGASGDMSDGGSLGSLTQQADERNYVYGALGRRQDGVLSAAGCSIKLRRAHSTECLLKKRDLLDDSDKGTGDERVNFRQPGESPRRYGWSDGTSWPRAGREDESNNWRIRSLQVAATPERREVDDNSTTLRRYSSPPFNMNTSLSHRVGSGVYVVPQKRGMQCRSPLSSRRSSDRPSGPGFFPFRNTPPLLTPEGWRPGCPYVPESPVDEGRQAEAWLDRLEHGGAFASATLTRDTERGPGFARDGLVSWRDRYENNPASRQVMSSHRRAMTEG